MTSRRRNPSREESKHRPSPIAEEVGSYVFILLIMGLGPALFVWLVTPRIWRTQPETRILIAAFIGAACSAPFLIGLRNEFKKGRQRKAHLRDDQVEEWDVTCKRIFEVEPQGDDEPVLFCEIDEKTGLLLKGQWLREPAIYGAKQAEGDPFEEYLNGLQPPRAFPTLKFRLARWPASGQVIQIEPIGDYSAPMSSTIRMKKGYTFPQSELIRGDVSKPQQLLDKASHRLVGSLASEG